MWYYRAYGGTWWDCSRCCWISSDGKMHHLHGSQDSVLGSGEESPGRCPGRETAMPKEPEQWGKAAWLSAWEDFSRLLPALLEREVRFI